MSDVDLRLIRDLHDELIDVLMDGVGIGIEVFDTTDDLRVVIAVIVIVHDGDAELPLLPVVIVEDLPLVQKDLVAYVTIGQGSVATFYGPT